QATGLATRFCEEFFATLISSRLEETLAERQRQLQPLSPIGREERLCPIQEVHCRPDVASDRRPPTGLLERGSGSDGQIVLVLTERPALEPVSERLLEVVADDLLVLAIARDPLEPMRDGDVLARTRGSRNLCIATSRTSACQKTYSTSAVSSGVSGEQALSLST